MVNNGFRQQSEEWFGGGAAVTAKEKTEKEGLPPLLPELFRRGLAWGINSSLLEMSKRSA